jgi:hypothetical protein
MLATMHSESLVFKCLGTTVTDQNLIQEEIKSRLNLGNASYHSVQNLFSSRLLSKKVNIGTYKSIILTAVLFWCETWSLILKEKHGLRVFEKRALRRIFGPKRDEMMGGWSKLHNVELHSLYSLLSIVRMGKSIRIKWAGHVARMGRCRILMIRSEGKRPLGRPRGRWVYNIKMGLREIGWGGVGWPDLALVEGCCEDGNEPWGSIKCWEVLE